MPLSPVSSAPADLVKDVDMKSFVKEVIEASRTQLVIVDFWATWCGPCKQLTPLLEKLVRGYKGAVRLAKLDIDRNPEIAQQMGIQSVPAVFAFFQGRPVDGFMGALPEAQVKSWIDKLLQLTGAAPVAGDDAYDAAAAVKQAEVFFAAGDVQTAEACFADIFDAEPQNAEAFAGLLRCLLAQNRVDEAKAMLDSAAPELAKHKALNAVRTAIELAEQGAQSVGATAELEQKLAANPADHQARFDLAAALFAAGQKEQAVDHLLEIVRRDRTWNEDGARKQLVKFFEALGPADPLTVAARKRLSSLLFA